MQLVPCRTALTQLCCCGIPAAFIEDQNLKSPWNCFLEKNGRRTHWWNSFLVSILKKVSAASEQWDYSLQAGQTAYLIIYPSLNWQLSGRAKCPVYFTIHCVSKLTGPVCSIFLSPSCPYLFIYLTCLWVSLNPFWNKAGIKWIGFYVSKNYCIHKKIWVHERYFNMKSQFENMLHDANEDLTRDQASHRV